MPTNISQRLSALMLSAVMASSVSAQNFPNRPLRFIIPYPPGGTTDLVGRAFAAQLGKVLGQQVIVDNRSGAAGSLGTDMVAKSARDGYTLGMSSIAPFAVNPACNPKIPYDPVKDFQAVTEIASSPHAILVNAAFPAKNYAEFLALIKASPGKYSFATAGTCGTGHMVGAGFMHASRTLMLHVPYRGAGPAAIDVLANQVPILIDGLPSTIGYIRNGSMRAILIASPKRSESVSDVPTFAEVGLEEVSDPSWYGLVVPAGTPDSTVKLLHEASVKALKDPVLLERFSQAGAVPGGTTPAQHGAQIKKSRDRMRLLVKIQNITPDS